MNKKLIKLFLRVALGIGFLSPVLDRFGIWGSTWGNWSRFVEYTHHLLPWLSSGLVKSAAIVTTGVELVFAIALIVGWKLRLIANMSGVLLLLFGVAMTVVSGLKAPLNASVFAASAAAFALATIRVKFLEV